MMRLLLVPAAAMLVAPGPAPAQTTATRRAREAVAIINSATPRLLKAYVDSAFGGPMRNRPTDAYVNLFLGLRERSGGLEWVSVQEESANRAVIRITRKLTGETNALQVSVEDAPAVMLAGEADSVTVGASVVTVTSTLAAATPPMPMQVRI